MKNKTVFLFPAFVLEYIGSEIQILESLGVNTNDYFKKAEEITGYNLASFDIVNNNFLSDELGSQYVAYIISCCASDMLKARNIIPSYVAGYSMGLYAALYSAGCIEFDSGLEMIKRAFETIRQFTNGHHFGMGVIGGLKLADIEEVISRHGDSIEVINSNTPETFVISGLYTEVSKALEEATVEGAIYSKSLKVSSPYHSSFLNEAALIFLRKITVFEIKHPKIPVISAINQKILYTKDELLFELQGNIHCKLNWHETFCELQKENITNYIECGAGKSLYKISRFLEGNYKFFPITKYSKLFI